MKIGLPQINLPLAIVDRLVLWSAEVDGHAGAVVHCQEGGGGGGGRGRGDREGRGRGGRGALTQGAAAARGVIVMARGDQGGDQAREQTQEPTPVMSLAVAEVNHTLVTMVGLLTQEEKQMSGRHMLVLLFIFYFIFHPKYKYTCCFSHYFHSTL